MLDGKAIKSTDAIKTIETMMNRVTAYTDNGILLGQITVDSKSNEIPAETIIENNGDYVLQLKANQGNIFLIFSII